MDNPNANDPSETYSSNVVSTHFRLLYQTFVEPIINDGVCTPSNTTTIGQYEIYVAMVMLLQLDKVCTSK